MLAPRLRTRIKEGQEDIYYLLAPSLAAARNSPHLEAFRTKGVEVLLLGEGVDNWVVSSLREFDGKKLQSVAQGAADLGTLEDEAEKAGQGAGRRRVRRAARQAEGSPGRPGLGRTAQHPADHLTGLYRRQRAGNRHQPSAAAARHRTAAPGGAGTQPATSADSAAQPQQDDPRLADWAHVLFNQAVLTLGARIEDPTSFVIHLNALLTALTEREAVAGP